MTLPDLTAYVRLPLPVPITKIQLTYQSRVAKQPGFIARDKTTDKTETTNQNKSLMPPYKNKGYGNEIADTSQPLSDDLLPNSLINPLTRLKQQEDNILLNENANGQHEHESY